MNLVPKAVSIAAGKTILATRGNAPAILFGSGVVGFGSTVYLACRATLKVNDILTEADAERNKINIMKGAGRPDYTPVDAANDERTLKIQTMAKVARTYTPMIIVGGVTLVCFTTSHRMMVARLAGVTAAYQILDRTFTNYRAQVVDEYGVQKDKEFKYEAERLAVGSEHHLHTSENDDTKLKVAGGKSQYARYFDDSCSEWKKEEAYNIMFLKARQDYMNHLLHSRGHVFLNEVYDALGMPHSRAGSVVGWRLSEEGDNFIDFGFQDPKNPYARAFQNGTEPYILLDFNVDGLIWDKIKEER